MGAGDDHLKHVDAEQHDHRLRAEVVQPADQPAEVHLVLNEINARPRSAIAGTVGGHEQQAGDQLDHEDERQAAAPDVPPLRAAGDVLDEQCRDDLLVTSAVVEPFAQLCEHGGPLRHEGRTGKGQCDQTVGMAVSLPCWNVWYFTWMIESCGLPGSGTSFSSSRSMPRGAGLVRSSSLTGSHFARSQVPPWHGQRNCCLFSSKLIEQPRCGQIVV